MPMIRLSKKQKYLWIPIIWMIMGVTYAFQIYIYNKRLDSDCEPFSFIAYYLPEYLLWAFYTPFILKLSNHFLVKGNKWGTLLKLLPFGILLSLAHLFLLATIRWVFYGWYAYQQISGTYSDYVLTEVATHYFIPLLFFALVVAIGYMVQYYHVHQQAHLNAVELENRLTEAQLENLKNQLQPHFLFNALNTISMLVRQGEKKNAVAMISGLGGLLRYGLENKETQWSILERELEIIGKYLSIESVRFGDKLQFKISSQDDLKGIQVPDLILQPLVENAIKHGLKDQKEGWNLNINTYGIDHYYVLEVRDNGKGFDPLSTDLGNGLKITEQRLLKLYGGGAKMEVQSSLGHGTTVSLKLPKTY